jgi:hypothetical protein
MTSLLSDALAYHDMGLAPVPEAIGKKKQPTAKYKQFYDQQPDVAWVRQQFSRRGVNGIAILPVNTGIATIDFDRREAYDKWEDTYPELAKTLPKHTTPGGIHVICRSDRKEAVYLPNGDGEYRGHLLSVWPNTPGYTWIHPLEPGKIPFVPSEVFIGKTRRSVAENAECHLSAFSAISAVSAFSAFSATSSPDAIIASTTPTKAGERNACILTLARGLKFNAGMSGSDPKALRDIVRQWHAKALAVIETRDFDTSWSDFVHAFERAKHPLGHDLVDAAALMVDADDLPEVASNYDSIPARQLIGLCDALAKLNGSNHFFLSSHDVAARLNIRPVQAWRLLKMLIHDGVIACEERGNEFRATRYRWVSEKGQS